MVWTPIWPTNTSANVTHTFTEGISNAMVPDRSATGADEVRRATDAPERQLRRGLVLLFTRDLNEVMAVPSVRALLFDTFGTVVDWRGGLISTMTDWGSSRGITADWPGLVDAWRGAYRPSMDKVRAGEREWA